MRRRIPGLEALTAFEAAARHLSFTRSADELALTQSAVGRQVAVLEQYVGVQLFNRIRKRLSLTEAGQTYALQIRKHLYDIERDTLAAMAHRDAGGVLEIAVIPTFATRWLIPRLPKFYRLHPGITLNLTTRAEPFLFTDTPFDAAIHFGKPVWPGTIAKHLFGEEITPVCSPDLLDAAAIMTPRALMQYTLLHQSSRSDTWRRWLALADIHDVPCMGGHRYELFSMLVEAARAGLGVALVPRFLVLAELASGALVVPCELSLHNDEGYYLVFPEIKQGSPALCAFSEWLTDAARRDTDIKRGADTEG